MNRTIIVTSASHYCALHTVMKHSGIGTLTTQTFPKWFIFIRHWCRFSSTAERTLTLSLLWTNYRPFCISSRF